MVQSFKTKLPPLSSRKTAARMAATPTRGATAASTIRQWDGTVLFTRNGTNNA